MMRMDVTVKWETSGLEQLNFENEQNEVKKPASAVEPTFHFLFIFNKLIFLDDFMGPHAHCEPH